MHHPLGLTTHKFSIVGGGWHCGIEVHHVDLTHHSYIQFINTKVFYFSSLCSPRSTGWSASLRKVAEIAGKWSNLQCKHLGTGGKRASIICKCFYIKWLHKIRFEIPSKPNFQPSTFHNETIQIMSDIGCLCGKLTRHSLDYWFWYMNYLSMR